MYDQLRADFPQQYGEYVEAHHIGQHIIIEFHALYKGKYDDKTSFMAWGLRDGGGVAATKYHRTYPTLDEALFDSIAIRSGASAEATYYAKRVINFGIARS